MEPEPSFRAVRGNVYLDLFQGDFEEFGWQTLTNVSSKFSEDDVVVALQLGVGFDSVNLQFEAQID